MRWWEVKLKVPHEAAEAWGALLQEWPEVQGVAMEGVYPAGALELNTGEWFPDRLLHPEAVEVAVYLPEGVAAAEVRRRLADAAERIRAAGLPAGEAAAAQLSLVDESSWENAWKEHYRAMAVGRRLAVVPRWEASSRPYPDRMPIFMEPGMAFGTGTHATTKLCLEALEEAVQPGDEVADVGCGTGILSIAAAKLGARRVVAIDIDPVAVKVAKDNVADNGVATVVAVVQGDLLAALPADASFDGLVANILRDAVIGLAPAASARLRPNGWFIASGFVTSQEAAVRDALERAGLVVTHAAFRDDWVALTARKRW
ncbi:ribosomal protein L11 methyltransferase [Alicyclobacillus cellulosilyticus]|uniref:Ribosomal protein L11 methyltransferase n=1 Tax=Alicyclobacillus cellulosilyticus TaxID=1003997 RepID=A0A917NLD5_9BACL|nr:50S ribosomal protein L11 methyltransferase [Alicyclobacillus cellulosilyticus]GGJ09340.1 ribosomal protein L11 methyltransferase [Alicyclobacillus cellulosilyticus]